MNTSNQPARHLSFQQKVLFSCGDLSVSIPLALIMFFQLYFLTDIAGLRPDLAGWSVGISRIWDAVNDPIMGLFSDRLRTRWGRRRVLLLVGAVPLGVSFILMWIVPPFSALGLAIYYALTFIVFDTLFTMIHVGYNALTPELTPDYDERSSINGFKMVFSISGTLGAIIFATVAGWYIQDKRNLFALVGCLLGLITIVPPFIVFAVTREKESPLPADNLGIRFAIRKTLTNRPFIAVMGLYLLSWTTASILAAVLIYIANYYLRVPGQANYFVLAAQGSAIVFIPVVVWISQRLDKRRAFIVGTLTWILVFLGIAALGSSQIALAYILAILAGFGIATAYVVPWSMIPDIIEHDELQTGQRREGSFYAIASFFQKLATGAAIWGMGQTLAASGYITPTSAQPVPVQPDSALLAMRVFAGPVPAILLALAILFAWRYPITRSSHQKMRADLAERKMTGSVTH